MSVVYYVTTYVKYEHETRYTFMDDKEFSTEPEAMEGYEKEVQKQSIRSRSRAQKVKVFLSIDAKVIRRAFMVFESNHVNGLGRKP
jgi:hypothetical protein